MTKRTERMFEEVKSGYEQAKEQVDKSFKDIDREFDIWKESVLRFEHSQYCFDGSAGSDNRVCNREQLWTGEDEDDIQQSSGQADEEYESDC